MAAMVAAPRGRRREGWKLDSGATFHVSYTRAQLSDWKKESPETTAKVADGNIPAVDGCLRIEVDLDQPEHTTKLV